ncbi:MAG: SusD/RagB family nutrient-binding outer membrane lipoprotein [Bacteroidales bacterium]|nr:SusD/RagB family nutrient-binding outer membrane lipoprotein [Bacteroidales bacterium]MDP3002021.1 SusD/RagB family nutrient-binding outer membrane lipoprotein [Bacteroidales bacterium]
MKKQISILLIILFVLTACEKQLLRQDELLQKRDAVESATPNLLLSSIIQQSAFAYQAEGGVSNRTLSVTVQYMQGNRSSEDNIHKSFTRPKSDLYGITGTIKLVQASIDDVHKLGLKSYEGIFLIFKSLLWSTATDLYGDIYYTEGLRGQDGILFPKFDEQKDIYPVLIQNLKDATQLLTVGTDAIDKTYDILYAGDKAKWIKFANSLRLRLLMRASKNLPGAAAEIAAVTALPLMNAVADNASIPYLAGDRTYNWPMSYDAYSDNFMIYRPSKTLVDTLKSLNDERLKVWVAPIEKPWTNVSTQNGVTVNTTDPNNFSYGSTWEYIDRSKAGIKAASKFIVDSLTLYAGYTAGMYENVLAANGSYDFPTTIFNYKVSKFSKLINEKSNPLLKACMLQSDEVQFLLAEAAVKGYISATNAETYYKNGVTLALTRWGVPLPAAYFNNNKAKFPATGTDNQKLAKIALQKWLGLFMMGVEAYSDFRRTRLPAIELNGELINGLHQFPLRFRYPETEMSNNATNYQIAIGKLDKGDTEFSKMWLLQ